jgi:hypothetical protein
MNAAKLQHAKPNSQCLLRTLCRSNPPTFAVTIPPIPTLAVRDDRIRCNNKPKKMQDPNGQDNMGMGSMLREVQELAEKFKVEEDEHYISPYAQLEKATVLQEAR